MDAHPPDPDDAALADRADLDWAPWLAWIWVGLLALCALAVLLAWDDLALSLDVVRHLR